MKPKNEKLTKAGLARLLTCSRSTITRLVSSGLKPGNDGTFRRADALRWIALQTSGAGGGWEGNRKGDSLRIRAERLLQGDVVVMPAAQVIPPEADALTAALRILGSQAPTFAQLCRRLGLPPDQAYVLGLAHVSLAVIPIQPGNDKTDYFTYPTNGDIWNLLLGSFDLDRATDSYFHLMDNDLPAA